MRFRLLDGLAWICSLACLVGFLLPWFIFPNSRPNDSISLVSQLVREEEPWYVNYFGIPAVEWKRVWPKNSESFNGSNTCTAYHQKIFQHQIHILNQSHLLGEVRQADRAVLLYAIPLSACFAAAFISTAKKKWALLLPLLTCAAMYGMARQAFLSSVLERLSSGPDIGIGLWVCLYSLLVLSVLLVLRFFLPADSRF